MPASRLKISFHMIAMATTGTTEGRKKIVRNRPTPFSRRLSSTAMPSPPATINGTVIAVYASVRIRLAMTSASRTSSV
jgi:hypothetical protein